MEAAAPRCLWIGRNIPYPLNTGANVYSGKLAESLAEAGATVRFAGFGDTAAVPAASAVEWLAVPGRRRSQVAGLFSRLPVAATVDSTAAYRSLLAAQLQEEWDAIVLDGYGTGWALPPCLAYRAARRERPPVLVHVSHNHEEMLWRSMAAEARGSLPKRLVLWQNYRKVRALERRIVRHVDMLTGITEEDAAALSATAPGKPKLALTPGHSGWVANTRTIDSATPRRVIIVGSFRWVIKQENLARFVEIADPVFHRNHIELDVVGDVPDELLATLRSRCAATHFHGFVDDIAAVLGRARIAVVPELIGGGFKLKFLDYIFARVPTATLSQAATGLAPQLQRAMMCSGDLPALVDDIVRSIDDLDALNDLQTRAFVAAEALFRWQDRGRQLLQAIVNLRHEPHGATSAKRPAPNALGVTYGSAR
jgi:glycosyltransferase involved in cell wall biosynthesis